MPALSLSIETVYSLALRNTRNGPSYVGYREECVSFLANTCRHLFKLGSTKLQRVDEKRLSRYLNCERNLLWESKNLDDASLDDMVPISKNSPGKRRFVPKTISLDVASKSSLV